MQIKSVRLIILIRNGSWFFFYIKGKYVCSLYRYTSFSRNVKTKADEVENLFNMDWNTLKMEIITLQIDSVFKITSEFLKYGCT